MVNVDAHFNEWGYDFMHFEDIMVIFLLDPYFYVALLLHCTVLPFYKLAAVDTVSALFF